MFPWLEILAIECCGDWLLTKFRRQCQDSGVFSAARNLRKQGVPLEVTLAMLRAA